MVWILFIIILAIGYALCGDTSGIEAICKGILCIALFLGVCWIIIEIPWLLILVVIGIIIFTIVSSNNTNTNISNINNTYGNKDKQYENKNVINPVENPTSFQSELQQNTKTPQQVKSKQQSKEVEQAKQSANVDYETIKRELLQQAESGNYNTINGRKSITFDHKYRWKPSFIGERSGHTYINKTLFNPSGQYVSEISIFITDNTYYDVYISEIKRLLSEDSISCEPLLLNKSTDIAYSLPHYSVGFGESTYNYEFVLRCSVQY